jgi:NAD+ kinase
MGRSVLDWNTFFIYAKNPDMGETVKAQTEQYGFRYVEHDPDFVITVGGDGTFLEAERSLPGIPKLLVRDSLVCFRCHDEPLDKMLDMIQSGRGCIQTLMKLEAIHGNGQIQAVNDIVLRNKHPVRALRFKLSVDGEAVDDNVVGDGIVAATPFGATGYYRSVTRSTFQRGFGLAFNNATEPRSPLLLPDSAELTIEITREQGQLVADNNLDIVTVQTGDRVTIRKATAVGRLVSHD